MSLEITGKITKILQKESGVTKDGKNWEKQNFIVQTEEKYNNLYFFEIFGVEQVQKFNQYNKEGYNVNVKFNVKTNEHNGKYYISLPAWRVEKAQASLNEKHFEQVQVSDLNNEKDDDLPF